MTVINCVPQSKYLFKAKTEKLKPLEVELRRLEDLSDSIVNGNYYYKCVLKSLNYNFEITFNN